MGTELEDSYEIKNYWDDFLATQDLRALSHLPKEGLLLLIKWLAIHYEGHRETKIPRTKISVIVPMWNVEKHIDGCLRSIAASTYRNFECICVDDGSPDASGKLAEAFAKKDKRFRVVYQKNLKAGGARNTGFKHATGDVISFVDADDYIHPQMFEILLNVLSAAGVDVAACALEKTDRPYAPIVPAIMRYPIKIVDNPLESLMKNRLPVMPCARLYRRRTIQNIKFIEGIAFEDLPSAVELMSKIGKYALVDKGLYFYHINPASTMRSVWSNSKTDSYMTAINAIYDYIRRNRPADLPNIQKHILNIRVKMIFNHIRRSPEPEQEKLWLHAGHRLRELYAQKRISYKGLKLKHKWRLWRLLHGK
ncbi:MAG: glycosyltransferase family 2 protein [Alphaproteobacteria bacterium]|nr:glycosyltransferase family 2 protein [Alphaproteobacteria bacterium]